MKKWMLLTNMVLILAAHCNVWATYPCRRKDLHQRSIIDQGCHFKGHQYAEFGTDKAKCLNSLISLKNYYYICKFDCSEIAIQKYHCASCLFEAVKNTNRFDIRADVSHCFKKLPPHNP